MTMQQEIETRLQQAFNPDYLEVINESSNHNVPPGSESHFKLVVVSNEFVDKKLIERHRAVNKTLAEPLQQGVHALAMHTYTLEEWQKRQLSSPDSPQCMGGGK